MSGLRSVTRAIAVFVIATPLIAQNTTTIPDTGTRVAPAALSPAALSPAAPPATLIPRVPSADPAPSWKNAIPAAPANAAPAAAVSAIQSGSTPENKALMIVGGSSILIGAIVGGGTGTVLMVGGSLVGLVGLWNYLK